MSFTEFLPIFKAFFPEKVFDLSIFSLSIHESKLVEMENFFRKICGRNMLSPKFKIVNNIKINLAVTNVGLVITPGT